MARVGISLGSNLGNRLDNLAQAVRALSRINSGKHMLLSGVYETTPIDCPEESPQFLNAVVEIDVNTTPRELLTETQGIEARLGRQEIDVVNAPRPLDIDLLYFDDISIEESDLTLPHPRMLERAFVVIPLQEIQPGRCNGANLELLGQQGVRKIGESSLLSDQ